MTIRKLLALSYAQKYTSFFLHLLSMVIVARLMAPSEVGVFAAGAAFVALGAIVAELGQEDYLVQSANVSPARNQTALGLALMSSWLASGVLILAAEFLTPSDQNQLRSVIFVLACALALRPFSLLLRATLLRELQFDRLYTVNLSRDAASALGGIMFVYMGLSAVGLALGLLCEQLILMIWAAFHHWGRGWVRPSIKDARELLRFGYVRTGVYGLAELGDSLSQLLIGGLLGYGSLGMLNRARKITTIFDRTILEAMLPVLLPYLSTKVRKGEDVHGVMVRKVALLSGIAWPFFLFLAIAAEPCVVLLLGEQWLETVPIIRVLCLAGIVLPYGAGAFSFLLAHQLLRRYLPIQLGVQLVVVVLAGLGAMISIEAACLAFVAGQTLKTAGTAWLLHAGLGFRAFLRPLSSSAYLTALTGGAAFASMQLPLGTILRGSVSAFVFSIVWLAGIFLVRHPLAGELTRAVPMFASALASLRREWAK